MTDKWIGRIDNETKKIQGLKEHLVNVSSYSAKFASKIGLGTIGKFIAYMHDMGKASIEFKTYIENVVNNPTYYSPVKIDHSTAAAKYIFERFNVASMEKDIESKIKRILVELLAITIMGHHGGLINFVDTNAESPFYKRINKDLDNYKEVQNNYFRDLFTEDEIGLLFEEALEEYIKFIKEKTPNNFEIGMITKFIHSCLIDADRLDAFNFSKEIGYKEKEAEFINYRRNLEKYLDRFNDEMEIDFMRRKISNECAIAGRSQTAIYTLTIPTGGGKTLSSVRFALEHAIENNLERIIYVVPYLSIIEQNAGVIREALGLQDELLEFHSSIVHDEDDEEKGIAYFQQLVIAERWDKPIIFTSMVQFLEVFYDRSNGKRRRLHNLSNSVIIYDECQAVPIHCTRLFKKAIDFLSKFCNSTGLLMTATQPGLENLEKNKDKYPKVIDDIDDLFRVFKRVNIINHTDKIYNSSTEISEFVEQRMNVVNNLLFICNTKSSAKSIYNELKTSYPNDNIIYLSTNLCAAHRKDVLKKIKEFLEESNVGERKLICITTQLIEAGVDISFQEVIRSLAGLDSIVQAAGRCNRNGEVKIANVYIVKLGFENLSNLPTIISGQNATLKIINDINRGLVSPELLAEENINKYFSYYYSDNIETINFKLDDNISMHEALGQNKFYGNSYSKKNKDEMLFSKQQYKYAEDNFHVIKDSGRSVIVPYREGTALIAGLMGDDDIYYKKSLINKSQIYTINLFEYEWSKLRENHGIEPTTIEGVYVLKARFYDKENGLDIEGFAKIDIDLYSI